MKTTFVDTNIFLRYLPVAVLLSYQIYQTTKNKLVVQALDDLQRHVSTEPLAQLLTEETLIQEVRQQRRRSFT